MYGPVRTVVWGDGEGTSPPTRSTIYRHLLDVGGKAEVQERRVVVTLDPRSHNPILAETGLPDRPTHMPWLVW